MKLDIKKWNEKRIELETKIRAIKHSIRREDKPVMEYKKQEDGFYKFVPTGATYRGGTSDDFRSLEYSKWEVTTLYAVRAALRGKQHSKEWSIEEAIECILPNFAIAEKEQENQVVV